MFKKTMISNLSLLLLFSISVNAEDNIEDNKFIEKIESGSVFKVSDLNSDIITQTHTEKQSFYINVISKSYMPSLKLEYNDDSYNNKHYLSASEIELNKDIYSIDVNLKYGDIVSYYTLPSVNNFGLSLGMGLRQYVSDIEYSKDNLREHNNLNFTVPLSYIDLFYNLNDTDTSSIGAYVKESEFNSHSIKDTSIYFKSNLSNVNNLSFIASYSTSNITLSDEKYDQSLIDSSGINIQLKYIY